MKQDLEHVEALLRQFRPRAPGVLPAQPHRTAWWVGAAAVAALAVLAASVRFMPMSAPAPAVGIGQALTLGEMRALVDADPATLDQTLLELSRRALPDVEAPDSALGQFARR